MNLTAAPTMDTMATEGGEERPTFIFPWSRTHWVDVPYPIYASLATYTFLVATASVLFNGVVIVTTLKCPKLRKPLNYMLLNLAVADFLCALLGGVVVGSSNVNGVFLFGEYICMAYATAISILGVVNLFSIVCLSISRYVIICKPFGGFVIYRRTALIAVVLTWVLSFAWNFPPLFWRGYDLEGVGTTCGPTWHSLDVPLYSIFYFVGCFFIPVIILATSYTLILLKVRQTSRGSSLSRSVSGKAERNATKMVICIMVAFLACWTPYAVISMYIVFHPGAEINHYVTTFPAFFAKSATLYNPCIYVLMNKPFRDAVRTTILRSVPTPASTPNNSLTTKETLRVY